MRPREQHSRRRDIVRSHAAFAACRAGLVSRVRIAVATEVMLLLGLCAFLAAVFLVERGAGLEGAVHLGPVGQLAFAALPALLWLGYFRAQDTHEPDPRPLVFLLFLAGALIAGPAADLAIQLAVAPDVAAAPEFDRLGADQLVAAFLVVAVAQELAIYLLVRYSVYPMAEIAQPIDGLIYTTAAALGFAAFRGHQYLGALHGEVILSVGAARVVSLTLAHASSAAALGLAIGWAKFSPVGPLRRALILFGGLGAAIFLDGLFAAVEGAIAAPGLGFSPWRAVAFAFGFAVAVFIAISLPMRRLTARAAR
jgi:RsiW-degrading membrane proteinase PrsW (M82 family)